MKTLFIAGTVLMLAVCMSCHKHDDNNDNNSLIGTWKVTLFIESGDASTDDFSGYTFNFASSGVLAATKSGATTNGTWSQSSNKFTIDLGAKGDNNKPLGELTDDWQIISVTSNEIRLTDDNPAREELLTFTKN